LQLAIFNRHLKAAEFYSSFFSSFKVLRQ